MADPTVETDTPAPTLVVPHDLHDVGIVGNVAAGGATGLPWGQAGLPNLLHGWPPG